MCSRGNVLTQRHCMASTHSPRTPNVRLRRCADTQHSRSSTAGGSGLHSSQREWLLGLGTQLSGGVLACLASERPGVSSPVPQKRWWRSLIHKNKSSFLLVPQGSPYTCESRNLRSERDPATCTTVASLGSKTRKSEAKVSYLAIGKVGLDPLLTQHQHYSKRTDLW